MSGRRPEVEVITAPATGTATQSSPPPLRGEVNRWHDGEFLRILTVPGTECSEHWEGEFVDRVAGIDGPDIRLRRHPGWHEDLIQWEIRSEAAPQFAATTDRWPPPTVLYGGKVYRLTGKRGHVIATGRPSAEYNTTDDRRLWADRDGKIYPED